MEFVIPTNREDMFTILEELFHYYRITRPVYSGVQLKELELPRLEFSLSTSKELENRAKLLVKPAQEREISERRSLINEQINKLNLKKASVQQDYADFISKTETLYEESKKKVEQQAFKNGIISSGMLIEKIAMLELEKNDKIIEIEQKCSQEARSLEAELEVQNKLLDECAAYFFTAHYCDVEKKMEELKLDELKVERDVFKYNNGLDEKEQRYKNTIAQINANLELKFLSISTGEYTKDQLVEMGYYKDVLHCVCGYYNTLPALTAYQDVSNDTRLPIFLDHYYQDILYMYQIKAGL